jgi:hypothetical protein
MLGRASHALNHRDRPPSKYRSRRGVHPTPTIIVIADRSIATVINLVALHQNSLNLELLPNRSTAKLIAGPD